MRLQERDGSDDRRRKKIGISARINGRNSFLSSAVNSKARTMFDRFFLGCSGALQLVLIGLGSVNADFAVGAERVDFSRDIRPLLSDRCFRCHGPDDDARESDLRLDTRAGLFSDLGGSVAVVPGDTNASELIRRIRSDDAADRMPPLESKKSLDAEEIELLTRWVEQGAHWEKHWSFAPPILRNPPRTEDSHWPRNEIDCFILNRLEESGLRPSMDAAPHVLVRRLYLDLLGLTPTPAEADAWVARIWSAADPQGEALGASSTVMSEEAYLQLVDYLLDSPHYGERWARLWLDLARYADTNGYEKDRERSIWPYRDWVIEALNADMPFDQFTIEQIAGDMLPEATLKQKVATGFHRNTMLNEEGGIDPLEFRYYAMTDRVSTTGTTWLGLTLGCCQCHAHKYDPISHAEYYQLMAFLNNADEPQLELPDLQADLTRESRLLKAEKLIEALPEKWPLPEVDAERPDPNAIEGKVAASDAAATESQLRRKAMEQAFDQWLETERNNAVAWSVLRPTSARSNLPILTIQEDNCIFASGDTAKRDDYYVELAASDQPVHALQLEVLPDERLPARGPGTTYYEGTLGDFYLVEMVASVAGRIYPFTTASETYAKNRYGTNPVSAKLVIDGDVQTGWSVHEGQGERHVAVFVFDQPIPAGKPLSIQMTFGRHFASSLGLFRFNASSTAKAPLARDYTERVAELLLKPESSLTDGERSVLQREFLLRAPEMQKPAAEIHQLRARQEGTSTLVFSERPESQPRPTYRHHRGEYLQPREMVSPATPGILHPMGDALPRNRLGFARWIVSGENPLTARVVVNRAWATFFGTGIVKTVDDFGLQGSSPSHPDLLDWLAVTWMSEDDWSFKKLHRRIVTSSVYRQSSEHRADTQVVDPENRLLSYFPRVRLDAEVLRDSFLLASGRLSRELGGSPVRPPQPAGITEVAFGSPKWNASDGKERYRRSIYTHQKRTAPFAMFATFDAPSGEACTAERVRSNSPLQALTLLNDVMIMELAQAAGQECFELSCRFEDQSDARGQLLNRLFRSVLTRPPTAEEQLLLERFWDQQRRAFASEPGLARALLGLKSELNKGASDNDGEAPERTEPHIVEQAAWTAMARALLGLDESQTRE